METTRGQLNKNLVGDPAEKYMACLQNHDHDPREQTAMFKTTKLTVIVSGNVEVHGLYVYIYIYTQIDTQIR